MLAMIDVDAWPEQKNILLMVGSIEVAWTAALPEVDDFRGSVALLQ